MPKQTNKPALNEMSKHDLSADAVSHHAGNINPGGNDSVRQRLAALLEPSAATDDPASATEPDDARQAGALIVRLAGAATTTTIATWTAWTLERATAAVAELDRRLDACGLRLIADAEGHLQIYERARLRTRPQRLPVELVAKLDDVAYRHALAHLVRGETCPNQPGCAQPLLNLGAAIPSSYPGAVPAAALAAAFVAARRRLNDERPFGITIKSDHRQ
jgi:hypothetical protein